MNWYKQVLKKYFEFNGRARRKEYWMFQLFNIIFLIAAAILDNILGTTYGSISFGFVYTLYALFVFIPGLAVAVRRLHDIGKSGGYIFVVLIPIIGALWLLVMYCTEGDKGDNEYGADPKEIVSAQ